ncbi:bile acid:sodium symporter family protein [Opitutus sp. ER46]|uniref:bile acid:sodium symporter family protein n=1 Tax=Opitutus sp. ER46 TaxID=2161864 RepID=UPI000D301FC2|nr:bile acid:sodium symporter family protein [Opitutus sp. ER46]PTX90774.1 bile acid:sodium symporter [Opitutus sp. ER46]
MKLKLDWFLLGMAGAVGLAWLAPGPGADGGWLHPELLTKAGIALIFFLHGLALSFASLRSGALNWRLHVVVQACTFLLFPLIGLGLVAGLDGRISADLTLGLFYLCALPSTVSSSVALTAAARGNVAGALFNATLSSLLGVVLTPLWIALVMKTSGHTQPLGPVIMDLVRWLVLPLAAGQLLRPWLGAWATRHKAGINVADRVTILLLVYTSFCDSFQQGVWTGHGLLQLVAMLVFCTALFALVMVITGSASRALGFTWPDRIAAMFCGSKKTLASGVPMAKLIFGAHPGIGLILLPIMIYHPLQLVICGVLAQRWAKRGGPA